MFIFQVFGSTVFVSGDLSLTENDFMCAQVIKGIAKDYTQKVTLILRSGYKGIF